MSEHLSLLACFKPRKGVVVAIKEYQSQKTQSGLIELATKIPPSSCMSRVIAVGEGVSKDIQIGTRIIYAAAQGDPDVEGNKVSFVREFNDHGHANILAVVSKEDAERWFAQGVFVKQAKAQERPRPGAGIEGTR